jgi:hypothetical protein
MTEVRLTPSFLAICRLLTPSFWSRFISASSFLIGVNQPPPAEPVV